MPTLYAALVAAGIPVDHHESDLYFPITVRATDILQRFAQHARNASTFEDATRTADLDTLWWYDVPFAYDPFWAERANYA